MKGEKLKLAIAARAAGLDISEEEANAAILDGVDMLFDFLADVKRIADAAQELSCCVLKDVDGRISPSFNIHDENDG